MSSRNSEYGLIEALRAHRVEWGPGYALVPMLLLGVAVQFLNGVQTALLLGALGVALTYWVRRARGWRRPYYAVIAGSALGWLAWSHLAGIAHGMWGWLLITLAAADLILAIPWWSDNVRRTHVQMEMLIKNWHIRAERVGLRDTWLTNMVKTDVGWSGKLNWRPGQHEVDKVAGMRSQLEGALGLDVGELRMPPDGRSTSSINIVAITNDPHAAPVMWDIPTVEIDGQLVLKQGSIKQEFDVGIREDGVRKRVKLWAEKWGGRHILVGGMNGSGKSGLLNLLWAQLALCKDVIQWGIDLKGGVELGPWRRCFDWVVDTRDGAVRMVTALNAEMQRRYEDMARRGIRCWEPSAENPVIVLSIDECASILGNATARELDLFEDLARKGRAAGIILALATQYPTVDAIGTTQIREQIALAFSFRMRSSSGEGFVITADTTIDAHKIDENRPGTCYFQDGSTVDKMPIRCYFLDDETVEQTADLAAGLAPILVEEVEEFLASIVPEYAEREAFIPGQRDGDETDDRDKTETGERDETETDEIPPWVEADMDIETVTRQRDENLSPLERAALQREREDDDAEPERLGEEEAHEALVAALRDAGQEGARAAALGEVATRKSTWTYDKLNALEAAGEVVRTESGRFRWAGREAHSQ